MEFLCKLCKRTMTYNEELIFCPFCSSKYEKDFEAVGTSRRKELLELIPRLLELRIETGVEVTLKHSFPKGEVLEGFSLIERYMDFREAESKRELLGKLDKYLNDFKIYVNEIDRLDKIGNEEILSAQKFSREKLDEVLEYNFDSIYDMFSVAGIQLELGDFKIPDFSHELKILSLPKEDLLSLRSLLLKQYEKLKAIVNDYSFLAIFGHKYRVGTMEKLFYKSIKEEGTSFNKASELYNLTKERLERAQGLIYEFDFFDMDNSFLVHVEDFWIALECFGLLLSRDLRSVYRIGEEEVNLDERLAEDLRAYYDPALKNIENLKVKILDYPLEKLEGMLRGLELSIDSY